MRATDVILGSSPPCSARGRGWRPKQSRDLVGFRTCLGARGREAAFVVPLVRREGVARAWGRSIRSSRPRCATCQWAGPLAHNSTVHSRPWSFRFQVQHENRVDRGMSRVGFVHLPSTAAFWCAPNLASSADLLLFLLLEVSTAGPGSWTCLLFLCFGAH